MEIDLIYRIAEWYYGRNSPLSWNAFFGRLTPEEEKIAELCKIEIENINYFSMPLDEIYSNLKNAVEKNENN